MPKRLNDNQRATLLVIYEAGHGTVDASGDMRGAKAEHEHHGRRFNACVNLTTARALEKAGLVRVGYGRWPARWGVSLTPTGRALVAEWDQLKQANP